MYFKISGTVLDSPKFARQIHYTKWPDFGCPENPEDLVNLVYAFRAEKTSLFNSFQVCGPIVIHCRYIFILFSFRYIEMLTVKVLPI